MQLMNYDSRISKLKFFEKFIYFVKIKCEEVKPSEINP